MKDTDRGLLPFLFGFLKRTIRSRERTDTDNGKGDQSLKIRKTTENDIGRVMEIYGIARSFMARHGNPRQWGITNWPPEELIREDIKAEKSYVCVNDRGIVTGTFFFDFGQDIEPTYRMIENGAWRDNKPYGVVHRLASDGSEKGTGKFCLDWAFRECGHLRVDTHPDNTVMQSLLEKEGFEKCGIIYVEEDNDPRFAYEK